MSYPRYPKYKDSSIPWLGNVPEGWGVSHLKYVVSMKSGDQISSDEIEGNGIYPVYGGNGLRGYTTKFTHEGWFPLIGRQGALCGNVNYAKGKFWASEHAVVVSPKIQCHVFWLGELLRSMNLGQYSLTAAQPGLSVDAIGNLRIPFPDLNEQSAIATFLDRETARIDALVAKKTRFIELLKEKRQALITEAVTGKFDVATGKSYPKYKDSGVEWLGDVPEHWDVKRLRHVASFKNSTVDKKAYDGQGTVSLCNYTDVYYNEFITPDLPLMLATASSAEIEQFSLKKGDVLITKDSEDPTDIGIPSLVAEEMPGVVCGYHLTMIRGDNLDTARLLHRILQSHPTQAHFFVEAPGITRYGLSQDAIGDLRCCLPPRKERGQIVDRLDNETARIDVLVEKTGRSIGLLKERRAALITAAVTGKIDVREMI